MITELAKGVYWVGVVDWGLRHFHGHELSTHCGTTYNAYLISDEKTVLVDTVWGPFRDQMMQNIREVVDPAKIDLVVCNHSEMDHSGALPAVLGAAPKATVVVSQHGLESVEGHYHEAWNFRAVKTGDRINIGSSDLVFIEAPMLHWPDSMFTYLTGPSILMPNDAFGQHYASARRFNDEVDPQELEEEALKYYVNILTPFSPLVTRKIDEVVGLNLPVSMICPSHGVLWRKDPMQIVRKYQQWARQVPEKRAVLIYDTMWEGTRRMAEAIGRGLLAEDVPFKLFPMAVSDRNDVLVEVFRSKAVLIGSPTINNGLLPTITPILEDLRGLKFKNKIGAAFGSYGWSGEHIALIEQHFDKCKIPLAAPGLRVKWQPKPIDLMACESLGRTVGQAVKKE